MNRVCRHRYGFAGMLERISNTAAYGAISIGPMIVDDYVKDRIRWAMENIKNGGFNEDWQQDYENNYVKFRAMLKELRNSQADQVGNQYAKYLKRGHNLLIILSYVQVQFTCCCIRGNLFLQFLDIGTIDHSK